MISLLTKWFVHNRQLKYETGYFYVKLYFFRKSTERRHFNTLCPNQRGDKSMSILNKQRLRATLQNT